MKTKLSKSGIIYDLSKIDKIVSFIELWFFF
jgi:hypothetical protein